MNDAAWERLVDSIDIKTGVDRHGKNQRPVAERPDLQEVVEYVEFESGGRQLKLERVTGPAIVDRKTHYSHRPGVANRVETIYDASETASRVQLLQKLDDVWQEVELNTLDL